MPRKNRYGSINPNQMLQSIYFLNTMTDSQTGELHFINGRNVKFHRNRRPYINANGGISFTRDCNTYEVMKIEFDTDLVYFTLTTIDENDRYVNRVVPITDPLPGNLLIII